MPLYEFLSLYFERETSTPHSSRMNQKRQYPAAKIPDNSKTLFARLYQVQHAAGKTRKEFVDDMRSAGYDVSERQLDRWVTRVNADELAISTTKATGATMQLTREDRNVVAGWVLAQNLSGVSVHLADYSAFCKEHLNKLLSKQTASRYLHEDGFSYRTLQSRAKGFSIDIESLRRMTWQWVQKHRATGIFDISQHLLASADFTFTGHRTERCCSFASFGGAQPMSAASIPNYTNCIITCIWADGVNRTSAMLFTYNAAFRCDRNLTERRVAQVKHLNECLKKYGITPERIVYVGKEKNETREYVPESPELLRRFFQYHGVPQGAVILSDNGKSFFEQGKSVLLDLGFQKHECYPAAVHHYLSPNDNRLHGTAKQAWRTSGVNYKDDVESCSLLLNRLDRDTCVQSKWWFDRNILALKEADLDITIGAGSKKYSKLHKSWLRTYRIWMGMYARGDHAPVEDILYDSLDIE